MSPLSQKILNQEQIKQLKNISDTLVEATEHFQKDLHTRKLSQTIHLLTSIVEGYEAVYRLLNVYQADHEEVIHILKKVENNLALIVNQLEEKRFTKVNEIVQFSLIPNFKKLQQYFSNHTKQKKQTTIGIFHGKANPREVYPEGRISALIDESNKQNVNLIFFSAKDIDFSREIITADMYINGKWETKSTPLPDVVNNISPISKHQQSVPERKLRRIIPFTSFPVGNKFSLPKLMVKHRKFADLLVPFRMITKPEIVYDYLEKEKRAVIKPILGARGKSIYFIQKKGNRFLISKHRQERIYNQEKFSKWVKKVLLNRKFSYMIQQYVECRTKNDEPFDIRAHMQKNHQGNWQITHIYPRIGSRDSILSNISRGGRTEELKPFLIKEYGEHLGRRFYQKLSELSLDLTKYLDRIHHFSLDEIGLDLAIDKNKRFWLHEANNGPQSTYHEKERAVHTIGYAKYIAEKGIVKQNPYQQIKGQFNAKTSDLPIAEVDQRYRIGMLKSKNDDDPLATACAYVAHYENVQFYTFTPKDIDFDQMLIKGKFFEDGKWVAKIVEYPHVIYDRLRLRGINKFNDIYEELEGIPFTNEFYGNSISKLEVYSQLKSTGELDDWIIPYQKIDKTGDIFRYIDQYGAVIIKPDIGSFASGVHYIAKQKNGYFVAKKDQEKEYSEISLRRYLNQLLKKEKFIVQQYIHTRTIDGNPFDIRVHLMKNSKNKWEFVHIYPRIGVYHAVILLQRYGGYISELTGFLKRNFPEENTEKLEQTIKSTAQKVAEVFSKQYEENFHEIALDLALDIEGNPHLIEVNVNKPGILNYEFDVAKYVIPYAVYLAKENEH